MQRHRIPKTIMVSDMKSFEVRRVTEGECRGKLGIFEGGVLIGLGLPKGDDAIVRSNETLLAAEHSKSPARRQLAKLIRERMEISGETFALAEINLVRTDEGLALWEEARKQELG